MPEERWREVIPQARAAYQAPGSTLVRLAAAEFRKQWARELRPEWRGSGESGVVAMLRPAFFWAFGRGVHSSRAWMADTGQMQNTGPWRGAPWPRVPQRIPFRTGALSDSYPGWASISAARKHG